MALRGPRMPARLEFRAHVRESWRAPADAAIDRLVILQRQAAAVAAAEVRALVAAAGDSPMTRRIRVPFRDRDGQVVEGGGLRDWDLVDERIEQIAAALNRSPEHVYSQLGTARLLAGPLEATLEAMEAGKIGYLHARAIAEAAQRMESVPWGEDPVADAGFAQLCRKLEARVLTRATRLTVGKTRQLAARTVVQLDPAGAARRRAAAWSGCNVWVRPHYDGLARFGAVLPALDAARMIATIDTTTKHLVLSGAVDALDLPADAGLGQVRAAVLSELVTGLRTAGFTAAPAPTDRRSGTLAVTVTHGVGRTFVPGSRELPHLDTAAGPPLPPARTRIEIGVVIDAATLLGLNPGNPAWLAAGGEFLDIDRADLMDLLASPHVDATLRRLVADPATGALIDRGAKVYRVSENLREWIRARDLTCSFPGCNRTARACDIDHAVDFEEGGLTTITNTRALCRRHHNLKTHASWRIVDPRPDGSCTFVAPDGHRYYHQPVPVPGSRVEPEPSPVPHARPGTEPRSRPEAPPRLEAATRAAPSPRSELPTRAATRAETRAWAET